MKTQKLYPVLKGDFVSFLLTFLSIFTLIKVGAFNGFNFGFTLGGVAICLCSFIYLYNKKSSDKIFNLVLLICVIALLCSFSLTDDVLLKFLCILFLIFISVLMFGGVSGNLSIKTGTYAYVIDGVLKGLNAIFDKFLLPFSSVKASAKGEKAKNFISVLIGGGVALPVLFVVIPLLTSSDIAFENMLSSIFVNGASIVGALVLTVVVTPLVFAFMFAMKKQAVADRGFGNVKIKKFPMMLINTFLSVISVVYIAYLFSQLAYITKAFSFLLPEDYTAAEFARSGFFQMGVIAFINLIILAVSATLVKRQGKKIPVSTKGLLTFLCCFTCFYIATAFVKMMQYIALYGLTRLRVLTSAFMLMLCVIFIIVLVRLFFSRLKYIKAVILVCAVTLTAVSVVDINTIIAEYNYNAYKAGETEQIDIEQLATLGVSSIPTLVKLAEDENKDVAYFATEELIYAANDIYSHPFDTDIKTARPEENKPVKTSILEKNLSWYRAKEALDDFLEKNPDLDGDTFIEYYHWNYLNDGAEKVPFEEYVPTENYDE